MPSVTHERADVNASSKLDRSVDRSEAKQQKSTSHLHNNYPKLVSALALLKSILNRRFHIPVMQFVHIACQFVAASTKFS